MIWSGGSIEVAWSSVFCSTKCPLRKTYGPTPQTWAGVLIWERTLLLAFGLQTNWHCPSTPGSSWPSKELCRSSLRRSVFADNSTAIAYLRNQGGTRSQLLNAIAQRILHWVEALPVALALQFIMGRHNVLADSLSHPNQILGSEWALKTEVFQDLRKRWPVSIDLCHLTQSPMLSIFFTIPRSERLSYGCSAPELEWVAGVCLSSLVTHSDSPQEAPVVLWSSPDTHSSVLASTALVPGSSGSGGGRSGGSASVSGPSASAPFSSASSGGVRAVASCLETIQRFAQAKGFTKHVAKQSALARCSSSRAGYQARWSIYRQWCHGKGHSVSRPSLHKIADFLFWLRRSKKLSISPVLGYRSMLSAVFRTVLPEISTSPVIQDLL